MTYAFMKYQVEGEQEAIHTLFDAFTDNDGWASETLEKLGVNVEDYDTGRVEWHDAKVEDKDGYSVLYFEEEYPYERGTLIDQLMEEEMFKGKLTNLYYYAEELANAELCETNDEDGKYFPYKILAHVVDEDGDMADEFFCKNEQELITTIREKYQLSEEYNSREALEKYFDNSKEYDCLSIHDIQVKCSNSSEFQFRIINSKWKETAAFFEGLAAVEDDNEKWGFIDESRRLFPASGKESGISLKDWLLFRMLIVCGVSLTNKVRWRFLVSIQIQNRFVEALQKFKIQTETG